MAYVKIFPIKANTHLSYSIGYVLDELKTNDCLYTDSYKCTPNRIDKDFSYTLGKSVKKKGNNLAWHIVQSFSPDDKVSPEQALSIGKELMRRMYPDYQYVISTHLDKEYIHNHIIMCSVNFKDFHKLNSNKASLEQLRKISDDICKENELSVIEPTSKTKRLDLKSDMDEAILSANSFYDFVAIMQAKGYNVRKGKYISFKSSDMKRYIRSSSISIDYSEAMIKKRIADKTESKRQGREKYDDKIMFRSKRKQLKAEIDASLRKAKNYEEFLADMRRKKFEVKEGKHLAFRGTGQERFIRSESISYHYSEEVIRFRLECREEWENMQSERIGRVIDESSMSGGMLNWAAQQNNNTMSRGSLWMGEHVDGYVFENGPKYNLGALLEYYDNLLAKINSKQSEVEQLNKQMREIVKIKQAVKYYWSLKPVMIGYNSDTLDLTGLTKDDLENLKNVVQNNTKKFQYSVDVINKAVEIYGTVSFKELDAKMDKLLEQKKAKQLEITRLKLSLEPCEDIRYNYSKYYTCEYAITEKDARRCYAEQKEALKLEEKRIREKEERKQERREKVKNLFHIGL